jgi:hypothetical protein
MCKTSTNIKQKYNKTNFLTVIVYMSAKMEIIELVIQNDGDGIEAISVVDKPAIESDFIALSKHLEIELKEVDAEKRILMGAALIPNKHIYRKDKDKEFYIFFSEQTVRQASELFFINGNQSNATIQHAKDVNGMTAVESWIVEDTEKDKSKLYGFDVPVGTWMLSMKVNNDKVWDEVKKGNVKGFSIEGNFADKLQMSKEKSIIDQIIEILKNEQ